MTAEEERAEAELMDSIERVRQQVDVYSLANHVTSFTFSQLSSVWESLQLLGGDMGMTLILTHQEVLWNNLLGLCHVKTLRCLLVSAIDSALDFTFDFTLTLQFIS
jgi:hypothetical protein